MREREFIKVVKAGFPEASILESLSHDKTNDLKGAIEFLIARFNGYAPGELDFSLETQDKMFTIVDCGSLATLNAIYESRRINSIRGRAGLIGHLLEYTYNRGINLYEWAFITIFYSGLPEDCRFLSEFSGMFEDHVQKGLVAPYLKKIYRKLPISFRSDVAYALKRRGYVKCLGVWCSENSVRWAAACVGALVTLEFVFALIPNPAMEMTYSEAIVRVGWSGLLQASVPPVAAAAAGFILLWLIATWFTRRRARARAKELLRKAERLGF